MHHRGPDDHGWLRYSRFGIERGREWKSPTHEPEVLLLHRRLSILDTSDAGWQPMSSADGRYHVVYNGEIYNYLELREELERIGHRFHTQCDTEVLLAAFAEWGTEALRRFVGMFAFAILDTQRRVLLLARDFFGIKPLYFSFDDGELFFGSEIKAILNFGVSRREVNAERLLYYLRYGITDFGSETLLTGIRQLPPAHFMEISVDDVRPVEPQCYWRVESGEILDISFDEAAQRVQEIFLRSVAMHLRSDVPVGAALSGGVDSSAIVMAVRHLCPKAEIHCFSYIAEDESISEDRWVDIVAKASGAHVHKVRVSAAELARDFEAMMGFHDEPSGGTNLYAGYSVFRAARDAGITVMLDGQGADEMLGGYPHYRGARLGSLVRQHRWKEAATFLGACSRLKDQGAIRSLASCADYLLPPGLQGAARHFISKDAFPGWLDARWFAERGVGPKFINYTAGKSVLRKSLARSLQDTLPTLLRYEDRNSMAFSVESRVPFLVPELVTFLGRLPEEYIIAADGTTKAVFRKAMRGIVPDAILDRRDKIGYATPEKRWLHLLDPWVRQALGSAAARSIPCLSIDIARLQWDAIQNGKGRFDSRIWRWIDLIRWTGEFSVVYD